MNTIVRAAYFLGSGLLALIVWASLCANAAAQILPAERRIDWAGSVGVEGGIPQRTTVRDCVAEDGAHADGQDSAAEIQACLDSTPQDGVALLPAGTYVIGAGLSVGSRKTLRGAGQEQTVLLADDLAQVIMLGERLSPRAPISIVSGYQQGSATLVLEDASTVEAGAYLRLDELNDQEIPVTQEGYGSCTWCGREQGNRVRGQLVKVTAKQGDTITIAPPMYFSFAAANLPEALRPGAPTPSGMAAEFSGVEQLTIKNNWRADKVQGSDGREYSAIKDHTSSSDGAERPVSGDSWEAYWAETAADGAAAAPWQAGTAYSGDYQRDRNPVNVALCANCWLKEVTIDTCGARCVQLYPDVYRFELRDSHIRRCINRWDSDNCYGTLIGGYVSGLLLENNIYESLADGPMFAWGASGNVVAYNYIYDAHRVKNQRTWFTGVGGAHHGAHTAFNLWEGNELESVYFDQYWGSHSHNTLYRNRILGRYMVDGIAADSIQSVYTIATERNVHYQSYVGNVLGEQGYHDTYELNATSCPSGFRDRLIYRTGYASSGNCAGDEADPQAFATMLRHLNFDYVSQASKRCDDPGEPGCQGGDGALALADSLYLTGKPAWFGGCTWPPVDPNGPATADLPAKLRFCGQRCPAGVTDGGLRDDRGSDGAQPDAGDQDGARPNGDGATRAASEASCGCGLQGGLPGGLAWLLLLSLLLAVRRRRRAHSS